MPSATGRNRSRRRGWIGAILLALPSLISAPTPSAAQDQEETRSQVFIDLAMTVASLGPVHPVEAAAAFETYARAYATRVGAPADIGATVFDSLSDLREAALQGKLKVLGLQAQDYFRLRKDIPLDPMFIAEKSGRSTESYVLLVRSDSEVNQLAHLIGKDLHIYAGTTMGMATIWLDVLLLEAGQPIIGHFFHSVQNHPKLSHALLPVFFNKVDACLVTRSGFETMVELNPQVGQQLQILASSVDLVPFVTCIRSDFTGPDRLDIENAYLQAHLNPLGRQALLLFGFDRMQPFRESAIQTAREMMDQYERLRRDASRAGEADIPN